MTTRQNLIDAFTDSEAMPGNTRHFEEALRAYELELANEILEAQADLQTPLGFIRLEIGENPADAEKLHLGIVEDRLTQCLARLHRLQGELGLPMYDPATHPKVPVTS